MLLCRSAPRSSEKPRAENLLPKEMDLRSGKSESGLLVDGSSC